MAKAQGSQCCCEESPCNCNGDPPPCLLIEIEGTTGGGDCGDCDAGVPVDSSGYIESSGPCEWTGLVCSSGGVEGTLSVAIIDNMDGTFTTRATQGDLIWERTDPIKPNCAAWSATELTYDAVNSDETGLDYDPTASVLRLTATTDEGCLPLETCPADDPPITLGCVEATIAGLSSPDCGCGLCSQFNLSYKLANNGGCLWSGDVCEYCGFTHLALSIIDNLDTTYTVRGVLHRDVDVAIVWDKDYDARPECLTWAGEELTYNAALSDPDGSLPTEACDPTGSTLSLRSMDAEESCVSEECVEPSTEGGCLDGTPFFAICVDKVRVPRQVRLIIPSGYWGSFGSWCPGTPGICPTGEFICDESPACSGTFLYAFGLGSFCKPFTFAATLFQHTVGGAPVDPGLRVIFTWCTDCPTARGHSTWYYCAGEVVCDNDGFDCFLGGGLLTLPFRGTQILGVFGSACLWEGYTGIGTSDCAGLAGKQPIQAQLLP